MRRVIFLMGLIAVVLTGCNRLSEDDRIIVQLDWFPEPEHGGLYQALAQGYFADAGLEVELISGGGNINVIPMVASGRAQIGQAASNQTILAAARGNPVKIVAAAFYEMPTVLMVHDENPIRSLAELDGERIMGRPGSLYIPYLQKYYDIDFDVIPQSFGLGEFLADPTFIQEGFYIAEFYFIEEAGVTPRALPLSESGYRNSLVLIANGAFLRDRPEDAQAFLAAYRRGWEEYLTGDPTPAHEALLAANEAIDREISMAFLDYSREIIIRDELAQREGLPYGVMPADLIVEQMAQLVEMGELDPSLLTPAHILSREILDEVE